MFSAASLLAGQLEDRIAGVTVLVIGDGMLDVYEKGDVTRLAPEGPVPVVNRLAIEDRPGGAANVAAAVAALGARSLVVSVVGDDEEGRRLIAALDDAGVDTDGIVVEEGRTTLTKRRIVGDGRLLARVDTGDGHVPGVQTEQAVLDRLASLAPLADIVVVSDYRYGVISDGVLDWLAACASELPVVVDSKRLGRMSRLRPVAATSNYGEFLEALGETPKADRVEHLRSLAGRVVAVAGAAAAAVTLDLEGVVLVEGDESVIHLPAAGRAVDPCGAGDAFTATMAVALAAGGSAADAARLGVRAAGVVAAKPGTAVCTRDELDPSPKWCPTVDDVLARLAARRRAGETVVLTNGCFDLVHAGHLASLDAAARLGDILVVAVNSDDSVRRLKGPDRPVRPFHDRVAVLSGLEVVDYVVTLDDDTPLSLLDRVRPDVYCKGGDYQGRLLAESELVASWGGRVEVTLYVEARSTTEMVERIRSGVR